MDLFFQELEGRHLLLAGEQVAVMMEALVMIMMQMEFVMM